MTHFLFPGTAFPGKDSPRCARDSCSKGENSGQHYASALRMLPAEEADGSVSVAVVEVASAVEVAAVVEVAVVVDVVAASVALDPP